MIRLRDLVKIQVGLDDAAKRLPSAGDPALIFVIVEGRMVVQFCLLQKAHALDRATEILPLVRAHVQTEVQNDKLGCELGPHLLRPPGVPYATDDHAHRMCFHRIFVQPVGRTHGFGQ